MEPTTLHTTKTSAPKLAAQAAGNEPPIEPPAAPPAQPAVELDRRGKQLPARQRVGGIITPQ